MAQWVKGAQGFLLVIVVAAMSAGCGGKKAGGGPSGPGPGPLNTTFAEASRRSGMPLRLLLATGYLESRLSAANATANYVSITGGKQPVARGTLLTQTAYGKTFKDLGLDPAKPESGGLAVQTDAYADWVQAQLKSKGTQSA